MEREMGCGGRQRQEDEVRDRVRGSWRAVVGYVAHKGYA